MGSHVTACLPRSPKRKVSLHPNRSKIRIPTCRNCPILRQFCNRWMSETSRLLGDRISWAQLLRTEIRVQTLIDGEVGGTGNAATFCGDDDFAGRGSGGNGCGDFRIGDHRERR